MQKPSDRGWIDLAPECAEYKCYTKKFFFGEPYPKSCWFCIHFNDWRHTQVGSFRVIHDLSLSYWSCELPEKEQLRERKAAAYHPLQQKLTQLG